ncbi:TPR-like protein [Dioscorea alata]|uniref:TPR-like protein n=1 Tax=Dioscorea alata TaxID=55571 RepID=A0ACB7V724_DIOAL|nr:TPR-like protein [Dioscorea alata]
MFPRALKCMKSDKRTLMLLDRCQHLLLTIAQIHHLHARLVVSGAISDPYAAAKLLAFYAISEDGGLAHARAVFGALRRPTAFAWNTMIRAHADRKQPLDALSLCKHMLRSGFSPNNYTFSFVLRACVELSSLLDGRKFHTQILKRGWELYDFVLNGLIHMYASCGCLESSRRLFDLSSNKDVISWTAMVHGYAKSGRIDVARELFDRMPERNEVSWSSMITAYSQIGMFKEALEVFNEMQLASVKPNQAGIVGALSACGFLGALDQGKWIHVYVERNGMVLDRILGTALIDMYAKCGCIENALKVFDEMPERDVFAYTSMISGLSNHGHSEKAIELFDSMENEGVRPNEVTFICVLSACGRMGLVDRGRQIFDSMNRVYGIEPRVEHYGGFVDLLSRAGLLEEARRVVLEMPMEPDPYVLGALLNACRVHGEVELGKETVESLVKLGIDHSGVHVLLSNMHASTDQWEDVLKVRKGMEEKKVMKVPGCSMIEIDGVACEFVAGDRSHMYMEEIMSVVEATDVQLKYSDFDDCMVESELAYA